MGILLFKTCPTHPFIIPEGICRITEFCTDIPVGDTDKPAVGLSATLMMMDMHARG